MNPFKYGCAVGGEHFCSRPKLERQLRSYSFKGDYKFTNPFFREWLVRG